MKILKVKLKILKVNKDIQVIYRIDGKDYIIDETSKEFKIGTILYDSRYSSFVLIENERDIQRFTFADPELYRILEETKGENNNDK